MSANTRHGSRKAAVVGGEPIDLEPVVVDSSIPADHQGPTQFVPKTSTAHDTSVPSKASAKGTFQDGINTLKTKGQQISGNVELPSADQIKAKTDQIKGQVVQQVQQTRSQGLTPVTASALAIGGLVVLYAALDKFRQHLPPALRSPRMSDLPDLPDMPDFPQQAKELQERLKNLPPGWEGLPEKYLQALPKSLRDLIPEAAKKQPPPTAWKDLPEEYLIKVQQDLQKIGQDWEKFNPSNINGQKLLYRVKGPITQFAKGALYTTAAAALLVAVAVGLLFLYRTLFQRGYIKEGSVPAQIHEKVSPYADNVSRTVREKVVEPLQKGIKDAKNAVPSNANGNGTDAAAKKVYDLKNVDHLGNVKSLPDAQDLSEDKSAVPKIRRSKVDDITKQ